MNFYKNINQEQGKRENSKILHSANRLRSIALDISKIYINSVEYQEKEIYQRYVNIIDVINKIVDFLTDCVIKNIEIDTQVLDQVNFIPYSYTKLKEDINVYANMANSEINYDNFIDKRDKFMTSMPLFLLDQTDSLLPTDISYVLLMQYHNKKTNFYVNFPKLNGNNIITYENDTLICSFPIKYVAKELNDNESSDDYHKKIKYLHFYKLDNIPRNITLKINDNKPYYVELFGKSIMIIGDNDYSFISFIKNMVKKEYGEDVLYKYKDLDNKIITEIMDDYYQTANTKILFQNIIPSDDYLKIVFKKIENEEFINWFREKQLEYLSSTYTAYESALINMKEQLINIVINKRELETLKEKNTRMDIIANPDKYSDEEIKKYIKTYD